MEFLIGILILGAVSSAVGFVVQHFCDGPALKRILLAFAAAPLSSLLLIVVISAFAGEDPLFTGLVLVFGSGIALFFTLPIGAIFVSFDNSVNEPAIPSGAKRSRKKTTKRTSKTKVKTFPSPTADKLDSKSD